MKKLILTFIFCLSSLSMAEQREPCTVVIFDDVITDCVTLKKIKNNNVSINRIKALYEKLLLKSTNNNIEYIIDDDIVLFINKSNKKITSIEISTQKDKNNEN